MTVLGPVCGKRREARGPERDGLADTGRSVAREAREEHACGDVRGRHRRFQERQGATRRTAIEEDLEQSSRNTRFGFGIGIRDTDLTDEERASMPGQPVSEREGQKPTCLRLACDETGLREVRAKQERSVRGMGLESSGGLGLPPDLGCVLLAGSAPIDVGVDRQPSGLRAGRRAMRGRGRLRSRVLFLLGVILGAGAGSALMGLAAIV